MSKLTTSSRNNLSDDEFALPGRRFPIPDANHARDALARASQTLSEAERTIVKEKVKRKFPSIVQGKR